MQPLQTVDTVANYKGIPTVATVTNGINSVLPPPILKGVLRLGRSSARKGADGEREVMAILRERGYAVERGGTQPYGQRPDLYGLDGIHLEIKRAEAARIWEWMQQSRQDAARFGDGRPTVIFRRSRSDWLVCMELKDWLTLYERAQGCKCGGHCSAAETGE